MLIAFELVREGLTLPVAVLLEQSRELSIGESGSGAKIGSRLD